MPARSPSSCAASPRSGSRWPASVDARWGIKTGKDGKEQRYFGYEIHTLVSVPDIGHDPAHRPALVHAMTVTPASTDVVQSSRKHQPAFFANCWGLFFTKTP